MRHTNRATMMLVIALIAGCHRSSSQRADSAAADYNTGGCVETVTLPDGSLKCVKVLEDLGEGWNCCSKRNNECTQGANVTSEKHPDGSSTTVVHCGKGYYPVFCQNSSSIGLICTTVQ